MNEDEHRRELIAALEHVLEGYRLLLTVAQDLAERAANGGQLSPDGLALHRQKFAAVESQIAWLRRLLGGDRAFMGPEN